MERSRGCLDLVLALFVGCPLTVMYLRLRMVRWHNANKLVHGLNHGPRAQIRAASLTAQSSNQTIHLLTSTSSIPNRQRPLS